MKDAEELLRELIIAEPPAALDALVLERALLEFQRCAVSTREGPSADVKSPARDRALDPIKPCRLLSPVRS